MPESLEEFRKRTETRIVPGISQAEVDANTYIPPTNNPFGANTANAMIDVARRVGGIIFPSVNAAPSPDISVVGRPTGVTGAVVPVDKSAAIAAEKPPEKPHPAAGTNDLWEYAARLTPEKLKVFVDKNQNNPNLQGVGYIETKNLKTGGMRIEPVISRPEQPAMNAEQLTAAGHYQYGIGQQAIARETAATRKVASEATTQNRTDLLALKRDEDFGKTLAGVGSVYDQESGKMVLNPLFGLHKLDQLKYPEADIPKHYLPVLQEARNQFKQFVSDWENSPKRKRADVGKQATSKERQELSDLFMSRFKSK